jgi:hypothetical protein
MLSTRAGALLLLLSVPLGGTSMGSVVVVRAVTWLLKSPVHFFEGCQRHSLRGMRDRRLRVIVEVMKSCV